MRGKKQPKSSEERRKRQVLFASVEHLGDAHSARRHDPLIVLGIPEGVEIWKVGRSHKPTLFAQLSTPEPRFAHILAGPRGADAWSPVTKMSLNASRTSASTKALRNRRKASILENAPLLAIIPSDFKQKVSTNRVSIYSITKKKCSFILDLGNAQPKCIQSNSMVVAVHVGMAIHIYTSMTLEPVQVFHCTLGAEGAPAFALGTRLVAVPSHMNPFATLSTSMSAQNKTYSQQDAIASRCSEWGLASRHGNGVSNAILDSGLDVTPDSALLSSLSTADWSAVDVAKGVEQSISFGSASVSYLASTAQHLATAADASGDDYSCNEKCGEDTRDSEIDYRGYNKLYCDDGSRSSNFDGAAYSNDDSQIRRSMSTKAILGGNRGTPSVSTSSESDSHTPCSKHDDACWPLGSIAIYDMGPRHRARLENNITIENSYKRPIASIAPPRGGSPGIAVSAMSFSSSGNMLAVAHEDGREIYVYALLQPVLTPGEFCKPSSGDAKVQRSQTKTRTQLMYRLQRGVTRGRIQSICFDQVGKLVSVLSARGTVHLFAINSPRMFVNASERDRIVALDATRRLKKAGCTINGEKMGGEMNRLQKILRREPHLIVHPVTTKPHGGEKAAHPLSLPSGAGSLKAGDNNTVAPQPTPIVREAPNLREVVVDESEDMSSFRSVASRGFEAVNYLLRSASESAYQILYGLSAENTGTHDMNDETLPDYIRNLLPAKESPKVVTLRPLLRTWNPPRDKDNCRFELDGPATVTNLDSADAAKHIQLNNVAAHLWMPERGKSASYLISVSTSGNVIRTCFDVLRGNASGAASHFKRTVSKSLATIEAGVSQVGANLGLSVFNKQDEEEPRYDSPLQLTKLEEKEWNLIGECREDTVSVLDRSVSTKTVFEKSKESVLGTNADIETDEHVEWLSRMEVQTFAPREKPIWRRPGLKISVLREESTDKMLPWWWSAPMRGDDTEPRSATEDNGKVNIITGNLQAAMGVPMFPAE